MAALPGAPVITYESNLAKAMAEHLALGGSIPSLFERLRSMFADFDRTRKPKHLAEDVEQTCLCLLHNEQKVHLILLSSSFLLGNVNKIPHDLQYFMHVLTLGV
jgi:hypothetical protein